MRNSPRRNVVSRGRFFFAALCFLLVRLSLITILGLVVWILLENGKVPEKALVGLGVSIGLLIVCGINILVNARRVCCPLCRASLFMSPRSLVKPKVLRLMGNAKVPLAFSLLTMPTVLSCPYCAEKVRLVRSS